MLPEKRIYFKIEQSWYTFASEIDKIPCPFCKKQDNLLYKIGIENVNLDEETPKFVACLDCLPDFIRRFEELFDIEQEQEWKRYDSINNIFNQICKDNNWESIYKQTDQENATSS